MTFEKRERGRDLEGEVSDERREGRDSDPAHFAILRLRHGYDIDASGRMSELEQREQTFKRAKGSKDQTRPDEHS